MLRENITIRQGSTFTHVFEITDANGIVDLTGASARMQIRTSINSPEFLIELTTANGRVVLTHALGLVSLVINSDDTAALESSGYYDLEIVLPDAPDPDLVYRVREGRVTLLKNTTR